MSQLLKGKQIAAQTVTLSGNTGNVIVSGLLDTNGNQVFVSATPTLSQHLANKAYVDAVAKGISPHAPVKVILTGNTTLSGTMTIDGYALSEGEGVLVNGQTDKKANGIYVVSGGTWSRRTDADGQPTNEIGLGDFVFVETGLTNSSTGWVLGYTDSPSGSTIDPTTYKQEWFKMASAGSYSASNQGIGLTGTTFGLDLDGTTLSKSASGLKVSDTLSQAISNNTINISTEVSDRISANTSLTTRISNEESNRTSGDTSLSIAISTELSLRISGDTSLSTSISSEASTRLSTDNSLSTLLSTEGSLRTSGDTSLSTALSTETSLRVSGITSLSTIVNTVDDLTVNVISGQLIYYTGSVLSGTTNLFPSLSTSLSTEGSLRTSGDTSLSIAISSIIGNTSISTSISTEGSLRVSGDTSLSIAVSSEASTRLSVDNSLSSAISTINSTNTFDDSSLSTAISSETTGRTSVDNSLSIVISTEVSDRTSTNTSLTTRISNETSDRVSADTSLTTRISNEESNRTSGDTSLSIAVSSEASTRLSTNNSLSTSISSEASTRLSTDNSLSTALSTEASLRTSGDTSLSTAISNINNPTSVEETFLSSNSGSTTSVIVKSDIFNYGSSLGTLEYASILVFLNGIKYSFNYASGTTVFHLNGVTPTGNGQVLYFDGVTAGFGIETDDYITVKYIVMG